MGAVDAGGRIVLSRRLRRPIWVRVLDRRSGRLQEYLAHTPLKIGYGKGADLHLDSANGPDTLFEFSPVKGPTKLSTPMRLQEVNDWVEVSVDGDPFDGNIQDLKQGARVQIRERASDKQYDLLVDQQSPWTTRRRLMTVTVLLLLALFVLYGVYVYQTLGDTEQRLGQAEIRLSDTEQTSLRIDAQLAELATRYSTRQIELKKTLEELRSIQDGSRHALREEFSSGLKKITDDLQQELSKTAGDEIAARRTLAEKSEIEIAALRREMSTKIIRSFEQFKDLEFRVMVEQAKRIEKLELHGDQFKKVLADSAKTVMFVSTRYMVVATMSGQKTPVKSAGTAFLVDHDGLAIAPQHVFEPWRYDDEFLAMQALGLVKLVPDSVVHHVWMAGEQVVSPDSRVQTDYRTESAFSTESKERSLVILHRPEPETARRIIASPLGVIEVQSPQAGPTDIIVFQLFGEAGIYPARPLAAASVAISALDEVLVVGYPMARLDDGRSSPQGVKGFVRRIGSNLLELDTALHPGSSGAPVLNESGQIVGMAIAVFGSTSYGAAIPVSQLRNALSVARENIRNNEHRWSLDRCEAGRIDGILDNESWNAMQKPGCEFRLPND